MSATNDGGPAFPQHGWSSNLEVVAMMQKQSGMTLRDWFAANEHIEPEETLGWPLLEALAGQRPPGNWDTNPLEWFEWSNKWQARVRYARADAMLAAREGGAKWTI